MIYASPLPRDYRCQSVVDVVVMRDSCAIKCSSMCDVLIFDAVSLSCSYEVVPVFKSSSYPAVSRSIECCAQSSSIPLFFLENTRLNFALVELTPELVRSRGL